MHMEKFKGSNDLRRFALIDPLPLGRFREWRPLARAIHGSVFVALDSCTGREVAIKQVDSKKCMRFNPNLLEDPLGEVGAGLYLSNTCPFIVQTLGIFQDDRFTYIISEYQGGRELFEIAAKRKGAPECEARRIMKQVFTAISHIHGMGIAHRDISMENTLLFPDGSIKILDFGQAVNFKVNESRVKYRGKAGKPYYRAPEMYSRDYYPTPADIFAAGVILFILILGVPPWQTAEVSDSRYQYVVTHGITGLLTSWKKSEGLSEELLDLLQHVLDFDPEKRYSSEEALNHPWMQGPEIQWNS